jgi:hypothetical protein
VTLPVAQHTIHRVPASIRRGADHAAPLLLLAALSLAWTWPLAAHLHDALPGDPGDNYSFVWNLWWMRRVLATPGLAYFRTTFLFYPFGATIADHPHTALPALVAATLLKPASVVTAQNVLLIAYVFANLASMYALAWTITRHVRASLFAAIVFGISPYVAVHLLGHFDLVAVWPLPLCAIALRRAAADPRRHAAAYAAGAVVVAAAYTSYYYVVYLGLFIPIYLVASWAPLRLTRATAARTRAMRRTRTAVAAAAIAAAAIAAAVAATGGWSFAIAGMLVSMRRPQNVLTIGWIFAAAWTFMTWRPRVHVDAVAWARSRDIAGIGARIALVFVAGTAPLLWQAAQLVAHGEYVTPFYAWRYVPLGIDLLAPVLGHPLHPVFGAISTRAYAALGQNVVESIGWFGIVPMVLLVSAGRAAPPRMERDVAVWRAVATTFVVWALGPFLTIGGFNTGLVLPSILLRYIPFVANARMPGRAIVVAFMAVAVLLAISISAAPGRLRSPAAQWIVIALVVFEFWAPVRLTPVDWPPVYRALAAAPPGAVCEVPLGVGDGLTAGIGSQDRRVLLYATQHEHPLVGGYLGRIPAELAERTRRLPIAGTLLALSDGAPLPASPDLDTAASPCTYLVVDRRSISTSLSAYVQLLAPARLASDDRRDLFRIR